MADTHPIIEAVAMALWEADPRDPRGTSWRSYLPDALAAARVILSAEPSREAVWAVCAKPYEVADGFLSLRPCKKCPWERLGARGQPIKPHPCYAGAKDLVRASNAALLREIQGSGHG